MEESRLAMEAARIAFEQEAEAMGDTKGGEDDEKEEAETAALDAALLEQAAALLPRQMNADTTAAWVRSLGALSPRDKHLLNRGRFTGVNLVGNSGFIAGFKPLLTEDNVHKATGVIFHMTKAELKAVYDKADITGNAPEFEGAVVDGETLYDLFTTQSFDAVIGDYFDGDELRPLGERLWADLTLIDDASRARDARRIFCILSPLLANLRARQEKGDVAEALAQEQEERLEELSGRQSDLVVRAFAATAIVANADGAGGIMGKLGSSGGANLATVSPTDAGYPTLPSHPPGIFSGTKLSDWTMTVEEKDWNGMTLCGGVFTHTSSTYGPRIIEGRFDTAKKMQGVVRAGGCKFVVGNILFKFADPMGGPYNSSFELAQKAAAHDLRGATAFAQYGLDGGVFASLQTIIDYGGFRLQAMQMLPIDGSSLVIGSGDACDTLPMADPDACKHFKTIADKLGLAEHEITVRGETARLHFGADVEGHRGTDGKLYVLDTA